MFILNDILNYEVQSIPYVQQSRYLLVCFLLLLRLSSFHIYYLIIKEGSLIIDFFAKFKNYL